MTTRHPTGTSDKPPASSLALDDLAMAAFDAMPSEAALIDPIGVIRYVNRAWRDFARANGGAADSYVGHNFFAILSQVPPPFDLMAMAIAQGVRGVLTGRVEEFTSPDHRCHRPSQIGGRREAGADPGQQEESEDARSILERRWFRLLARPLQLREGSDRNDGIADAASQAPRQAPPRWALLVYENVTTAHQPRYILGGAAGEAIPAPQVPIPQAPTPQVQVPPAPIAQAPSADGAPPAPRSVDKAVFLQAILDDIGEMVVTTDEQGNIRSFNRAAERTFGYAAAAVLGGNISLLMAEADAAPHDGHIKRYRDTGIGHVLGLTRNVLARRSSGEIFWVELRTTECRFDGERLFVSTMHDLSERRQMEADLQRAKQAAEASNRAKSDFLARMSHELRTPLNSILGFAEVIKGQLFGNDPARYAEYAQNIYESGSWLLTLINDILDLSKIEAGRLELKITREAPAPLIHASVDIVSAQLARRNLALTLDLPEGLPAIDIDARAFQQILINLLSNAIKFTPSGGQIRIAAAVQPAAAVGAAADISGNELQLTISDTGIGIPPEQIERVLEPFGHSESGLGASSYPAGQAAGDAAIPVQKGSGLGLSICKLLMELQHGSLALASRPGEGTTVTLRFRLPA